ncbi:MAG: hypothetical protein V4598_05515 [Bdellovibrionota bacterium]
MDYFIEVTLPFILSAIGFIFLFFRLFKQFTGKQVFKIASPCSQHWSEFKGNSKVRHCGVCDKNVHNVCNMSKSERKVLLDKMESGQRVCIYLEPPFFKRAGYFMFALVMCVLGRVGYQDYKNKHPNNSSGIMMGMVLDERNFQDFGKIDP